MISSQPLMKPNSSSAISPNLGAPQQALAVDAVHSACTLIDIALRIQVSMELPPAGASVEQLHAADLDDAVATLGFQSGGLGIQNDLSHGVWLALSVHARV